MPVSDTLWLCNMSIAYSDIMPSSETLLIVWCSLLGCRETMVRASRAHNLMCSNKAQREAYQKCFLEYYYCATVQGELSDIPAKSAGPYIHVGQAWRDYILPKTYNGDIDIMHICLIWTLLVRSILGRFLLLYWDVSFVCLNTCAP